MGISLGHAYLYYLLSDSYYLRTYLNIHSYHNVQQLVQDYVNQYGASSGGSVGGYNQMVSGLQSLLPPLTGYHKKKAQTNTMAAHANMNPSVTGAEEEEEGVEEKVGDANCMNTSANEDYVDDSSVANNEDDEEVGSDSDTDQDNAQGNNTRREGIALLGDQYDAEEDQLLLNASSMTFESVTNASSNPNGMVATPPTNGSMSTSGSSTNIRRPSNANGNHQPSYYLDTMNLLDASKRLHSSQSNMRTSNQAHPSTQHPSLNASGTGILTSTSAQSSARSTMTTASSPSTLPSQQLHTIRFDASLYPTPDSNHNNLSSHHLGGKSAFSSPK
jgi:hypothetical protein